MQKHEHEHDKKHYLITGGCGFIGSHLVKYMSDLGHTVTVLDNLSVGKRTLVSPEIEVVVGDVCDAVLLKELLSKSDGCFHLAGILGINLSENRWLSSNYTNLVGTLNVFNTAKELLSYKKIPIIYASSCAVYGDCASSFLSEKNYPHPLSAYAVDKLACELHAKVASVVHQIPAIGLRFFNVYGPGKKLERSSVVSKFVDCIVKNRPIIIFGNGEQTRDFIWIQDVVEALEFFIKNYQRAEGVYNICTGRAITLNQLVQVLSKTLNKTPVSLQYLPPQLGDAFYSCGDPKKANLFGWFSRYTLLRGLSLLSKL